PTWLLYSFPTRRSSDLSQLLSKKVSLQTNSSPRWGRSDGRGGSGQARRWSAKVGDHMWKRGPFRLGRVPHEAGLRVLLQGKSKRSEEHTSELQSLRHLV